MLLRIEASRHLQTIQKKVTAMTLFEIIFSIPGLIAMTFIGPIVLGLIIVTIRDFIGWTIDTAQSFETEPETQPVSEPAPKAPRPENVIDFEVAAMVTAIRNHDSMRFVSKG